MSGLTRFPIFESVEQFYALDQRRRMSRELDFGVWWKDEFERNWRITWVADTGEVIAVALGQTSVAVLGDTRVVFGGAADPGMVVLLAGPGMSESEVEARMAGWADVCGTERSVEWVVQVLGI